MISDEKRKEALAIFERMEQYLAGALEAIEEAINEQRASASAKQSQQKESEEEHGSH